MGRVTERSYPALRNWLSVRVQALSPNALALLAGKLTPAFRRRTLATALLLSAVLLGAWASDKAQTAALEAWEAAHFPSILIWEHGLGSRGFKRTDDPKLVHRIFRSLPNRLSDSKVGWIDLAGTWVVLPGTEPSGQPLAYCERCTEQPKGWQPIDFSWRGFESLLAQIDATRSKRPAEGLKKASSGRLVTHDPLEIRY